MRNRRLLHKLITGILMIALLMPAWAFQSYAADEEDAGSKLAKPSGEITSEEIALDLYGNGDDPADADSKSGEQADSDSKGNGQKNRQGRNQENGKGNKNGNAAPVLHTDPVAAMVQKYSRSEGTFTLSESSRFFIASSNRPGDELLSNVRLMDVQFAAKELPSQEVLPVVYADSKYARSGDIVVEVVDEAGFAGETGLKTADVSQQYKLVIDDKATITACSATGAYYGLITLMEMCINEGASEGKIELAGCTIDDGPDTKERVLFIDCGRKYFTKDYLLNLIRRSSMQRYNAIELHFSEAEGLRFDSEAFPWLTEGIDSISREEMVEIVETARTYNMDVIPSIDVPGHNEYIVKKYAEHAKKTPDFSYEYEGVKYDKKTRGFGSIANHYSHKGKIKKADYIGIDITEDHAVAFMDILIDDYAAFFRSLGCNNFALGGDEIFGWYSFTLGGKYFDYNNRWESVEHWDKYAKKKLGIKKGSASDTFISYMNHIDDRLSAQGSRCRVFGDEVNLNRNQHLKLNSTVDVLYWYTGTDNYSSLKKDGYKLYNDMEYWVYYVTRKVDGKDIMSGRFRSVNSRNIYENWNPRQVQTGSGRNAVIPEDRFSGAYFNIWCDHPSYKKAGTIWRETEARSWANSVKMWNTEISTDKSGAGAALSYKDFIRFTEKIGQFPGFSGESGSKAQLPAPAEIENAESFWGMVMKMFSIASHKQHK